MCSATIDMLRSQVAAIERGGVAERRTVALGLPELEVALPDGGLVRGAVHEAVGPAAAGFAAMVAGRLEGAVLWCVDASSPVGLYGPGIAAFGLHPARVMVARCQGRTDLLWVMEEGLRMSALAAVIGEPSESVDLTASRRLQLAAEMGGTLGIVVNPEGAGRFAANALESRWHVTPAPAEDVIRPCWKVSLERCRGGTRGLYWIVERNEETGNFAVVAAPADRSAAAAVS